MKNYIFTDLACEFCKINEKNNNVVTEVLSDNVSKITVTIRDTDDEIYYGKSRGIYSTFFSPRFWELDNESFDVLSKGISMEIKRILKNKFSENKILDRSFSLLIAGIGNPALNPDALGAETVKNIIVTRHIKKGIPMFDNRMRVSAIITDVTGNTGIEVLDILKSHVKCISPDALIVIDSLATKSSERLASTVQISDSDILPGSGIGQGRAKISSDRLGVPIISIGVPTVINSSTMLVELLQDIGINKANPELQKKLEGMRGFFVTPKEIDAVIKYGGMLLSESINMATVVE